jgi:uncharacterized protein YkwD
VAVLAVAANAAATHGPARAQADERMAAVAAADRLDRQLLRALNRVRGHSGLRPLRLSRGLAAAASSHSRSMAILGYFSHTSEDGSRFWERIGRFYRRPPNWRVYIVGENLIQGGTEMSAQEVIRGWLESPPHRENMLGRWTEVGFGAVRALGAPGVFQGQDVAIVTADFGIRG